MKQRYALYVFLYYYATGHHLNSVCWIVLLFYESSVDPVAFISPADQYAKYLHMDIVAT